MSKDANLRLQEVIACVPKLIEDRTRAEQVMARLEEHVATLQGNGRQALDKLLHFGGFHPRATDSDRQLRNLRRLLLLALDSAGPGAAKEKSRVESLPAPAIATEFQALFNAVLPAMRPDEVTFASSFMRYAKDEERAAVQLGAQEMAPLLRRAVGKLTMVRSDRQARANFEHWFGAYTETKLATVLGNFNRMANTHKRLKLYYRGNNLTEKSMEAGYPGAPEVRIHPVSDAGYYSPDARRDADPELVHIFVGAGFFSRLVAKDAVRGSLASRGGILLHELSHYLCRTNDEKSASGPGGVMYAPTACEKEAKANNPRVVTNADSYRCYADYCGP